MYEENNSVHLQHSYSLLPDVPWLQPNQPSGQHNSHALADVSDNVNNGCAHGQIVVRMPAPVRVSLPFFFVPEGLIVIMFFVRMRMPVIMTVIMTVIVTVIVPQHF